MTGKVVRRTPPASIFINGKKLRVVDNSSCIHSQELIPLIRENRYTNIISIWCLWQAWSKYLVAVGYLSHQTKIVFYQASCLNGSFIYEYETFTIYRRHIKNLEHFHLWHLRWIMEIYWHTYTANTVVLRRTSLTMIELLLWNTVSVGADKLFASVGCFNRPCIENLEMASDQPRNRFKDCLT